MRGLLICAVWWSVEEDHGRRAELLGQAADVDPGYCERDDVKRRRTLVVEGGSPLVSARGCE